MGVLLGIQWLLSCQVWGSGHWVGVRFDSLPWMVCPYYAGAPSHRGTWKPFPLRPGPFPLPTQTLTPTHSFWGLPVQFLS